MKVGFALTLHSVTGFATPYSRRPTAFFSHTVNRMSLINRQLRLKTRPEGLVTREDFDLVEQAVPELKDGEVLVRVLYLSMDPTNRVWMRDIPQYLPPVAIGEVMRALGLGRVVQSRSMQYREGDLVQGVTGWQDYLVFHDSAKGYVRLPADPGIPLPTLLGAAGMSGVTAYYGLTESPRYNPARPWWFLQRQARSVPSPGRSARSWAPAWSASPAAPTNAATSLTSSASMPPSTTRPRTSSNSSRSPRPTACT